MEEALTFWLDNKICSGFKMAEIGRQTLVLYRDKYYIVVAGAAQMKGVRPLHFSKTSMPPLWKKALKGILPTQDIQAEQTTDDDCLPVTTTRRKERPAMQKVSTAPLDTAEEIQQTVTPSHSSPKKSASPKPSLDAKPAKTVQTAVTTACPYCNFKQEIPFEKGRSGKPFFATCAKCGVDFAVRFVPVTVYQAQVAAFK